MTVLIPNTLFFLKKLSPHNNTIEKTFKCTYYVYCLFSTPFLQNIFLKMFLVDSVTGELSACHVLDA